MLSWQSTLDLVDLLRTRALQWRGSTVEGRRAREVQRPEGVRTDPYDYHYQRLGRVWRTCSRQGILRTRWLDPHSNKLYVELSRRPVRGKFGVRRHTVS